jgi:hypothetical protein
VGGLGACDFLGQETDLVIHIHMVLTGRNSSQVIIRHTDDSIQQGLSAVGGDMVLFSIAARQINAFGYAA